MRIQVHARRRAGVVWAEAGLGISAFMMLVLGMLDLGVGVLYQNQLTLASRAGTRAAMVHGSLSGSDWGTTTYGPVAANTNNARTNAISPFLTAMNTANVNA